MRNPVPVRLRSPFVDFKLGGAKGSRTSTFARLAKKVIIRDGKRCQACGGSPPMVKLTVDHQIPLICGGRDEMSNLRTLCTKCHVALEQAV